MAGKHGIRNIPGMRGRRKGGNQAEADRFDRSHGDTLASLIDAWSQRLETLNYSARTLETHRRALHQFLEWTEARDLGKPDQITRPILESFQRWLHRYRKENGKPLAIVTQRARLGAIQRLFSWLTRENHLQANPAADLELPRQGHRPLPKGLTREELAEVFRVPNVRDPLGVRDRAILETLYASAARRSELVNLDLTDVDAERQTVHIRHGKGGKSRVVPIGRQCLDWLERYVEEVRPRLELDAAETALFLSGYGERLSAGYLSNWTAKVIKSADIGKTGSCHLFRHSCATHMLENGADVRFIQQMLGHANLATTSIYTEVAIAQLQEVYRRTHPSAIERKRGDNGA